MVMFFSDVFCLKVYDWLEHPSIFKMYFPLNMAIFRCHVNVSITGVGWSCLPRSPQASKFAGDQVSIEAFWHPFRERVVMRFRRILWNF